MTLQKINELRNVIRRHNRLHPQEFRLTFKQVYDHVEIRPAKEDTIYYGELLAHFCCDHDLQMFIMGNSYEKFFVSLV